MAPPPADAPPPQAEALAQLKGLGLSDTQITDAGCAHLASRLRSGALPALEYLNLQRISASEAARAAVYEARPGLRDNDSQEWVYSSYDDDSQQWVEAYYMYDDDSQEWVYSYEYS